MKKPQIWFCEQCGILAATMYDVDAGVLDVVHRIANDHTAVSPTCRNTARGIRVLNLEAIKESEVLARADTKVMS